MKSTESKNFICSNKYRLIIDCIFFLSAAILLAVSYSWILSREFFFYPNDSWALLYRVSLHPWGLKTTLSENFSLIPPSLPHLIGDRQFSWLLFSVMYKFFGLNAGLYSLINVILHYFNGLLVYLIGLRFFRGRIYAAFASALFLLACNNIGILPMQVYFIDIVCTFFILISLFLFLTEGKVARFFSVVFFIFALRSKEFGIVLPCALFSLEFFYSNKRWQGAIKDSLKKTRAYFFILLIYILGGGENGIIANIVENLTDPSRLFFLGRSGRDFDWNASTLFSHMDYYVSLLFYKNFTGLFFVFLFAVCLSLALKMNKTVSFGLLFFLFIAPVVTQSSVADYWVYPAQTFMYLFLASLLSDSVSFTVKRYPVSRYYSAAIISLVVALLLILPYIKNGQNPYHEYFLHTRNADKSLSEFLNTEFKQISQPKKIYIDDTGINKRYLCVLTSKWPVKAITQNNEIDIVTLSDFDNIYEFKKSMENNNCVFYLKYANGEWIKVLS